MPQEQHGVLQQVIGTAADKGVVLKLSPITAALQPTIDLVASGLGFSLLPMSAIHNRLDRRGLAARRIVRPKLSYTVSLGYPTHRPLTQASLAVIELIREAIQNVHKSGKWPGKLLIAKTSSSRVGPE